MDRLEVAARPVDELAWTLRPATPADRDFAFELNRETMKEYVGATWGWDDAEQEALFEESFDPTDCEIVHVGQTDIGLLAVGEDADEIYLAGIDLLPEWQGRGIGSSIVRSLLERGAASGKPVTLRVLHTNPRAEALYVRLGFTRFRTIETHAYLRADPPARNDVAPMDTEL
jgi:ribosomal protein S18 acetylase RimI-like enzyme